jgi:hypothetical protein
MLVEFTNEWIRIHQEKTEKIADLIKRAVKSRVHVTILVQSEEAKRFAEQIYLGRIGIEQNEFLTVELMMPGCIRHDRLNISFEIDCI